MRAVLLAAGYATRLYPFTREVPKPLLPVCGVPLLEYILGKVFLLPDMTDAVLVANRRFHEHFANWLAWRRPPRPLLLLDDGSTSNETRLGAIGDLQLAVERGAIDDDLLVLATDNLFAFDLRDFVSFFRSCGGDAVIVQHEPDAEARKHTGIVELDGEDRVIGFEEKPQHPKTSWRCPPFYLYRRDTVPLISHYLRAGNNPDAPGHFVAWLHRQRPVYGFKAPGDILDIGSPASYEIANRKVDRAMLQQWGVTPW